MLGRHDGFTLVEMLLVVLVLGLAASLSVPRSDAVDQYRAEAAVGEITEACRFAQGAALRTGAAFSVSIDPAAQVVRVYQLDAQGKEDASRPVMHPVDKSLYRLAFGGGALRATIVSAVFKYNSGLVTNVVSFGPDGTPEAVGNNGKFDPMNGNGQIQLRHGRVSRKLTIDAATGRVTS